MRGKSVLITGGSRGIGLAACIAFAREGANVAFTYEKNEAAAADAMKQIEQFGVKVKSFRADSTDEALFAGIVADIVGEWGTLDAAVANAGIWEGSAIEDMAL